VAAMTDLIHVVAETLPLWRTPAVALLALFVVGCLTFALSAWGEP